MSTSIRLRPVEPADIAAFYVHSQEAFVPTSALPADDECEQMKLFEQRWERQLADRNMLIRSIVHQGSLAGYVAHFPQFGKPAIAYWLGREFWSRGIATAAVGMFIPLVNVRPLFARVSPDNRRSIRVLAKLGFVIVANERESRVPAEVERGDLVFALTDSLASGISP
jgi:RimJ/RimL family protein N-acetyltransferase